MFYKARRNEIKSRTWQFPFKNSSVNPVEELYGVKSFKFQVDVGNIHFCCWNQRGLYTLTQVTGFCIQLLSIHSSEQLPLHSQCSVHLTKTRNQKLNGFSLTSDIWLSFCHFFKMFVFCGKLSSWLESALRT